MTSMPFDSRDIDAAVTVLVENQYLGVAELDIEDLREIVLLVLTTVCRHSMKMWWIDRAQSKDGS